MRNINNSLSKLCLILSIACFLSSCGNNGSNKKSTKQDATETTNKEIKKSNKEAYEPKLPAMIQNQDEQLDYLIGNYWDGFDIKRATKAELVYCENSFAGFVNILTLPMISESLANKGLNNFVNKITQNDEAYDTFMEAANNVIYDPNSPIHNESLYTDLLEIIIKNDKVDETRKSILEWRLELLKRNLPGNQAMNFQFETIDGKKTSLANYKTKGEKIILLFFDPNCNVCHSQMEIIQNDENLKKLIEAKKIDFLAIYVENKDEDWAKIKDGLVPEIWTVGNDHRQISNESLYDLKAMPTIYLLDKDKKVILKDAPFNQIMSYLLQ